MLSNASEKKLRRQLDLEQHMTEHANRIRRMEFAKRLGKAIAVGLFAYITMVTGQVAGWIAIPIIGWSLCYGAATVDKYMEWRCAPWLR